jgi:exosortase
MVDSFQTQTPTREPKVATDPPNDCILRRWLLVLALVALWLPILYLLSPQWSIYDQYSYGWAVPVLCLFLAWQRWRSSDNPLRLDRKLPSPHPMGRGAGGEVDEMLNSSTLTSDFRPLTSDLPGTTGDSPVPLGASPSGLRDACTTSDLRPLTSDLCPSSSAIAPRSALPAPCSLLIFFGLLLLPIRILQEANPLWRAASYALAFDAIAITLLLAYLGGGFPSAKRFAFPVCFFLVAIPWPTPVETFVVQNLTRFNTLAVTEVVNGIGIAAMAHGNIIEVSTGKLGVEEACSGIRSLQAVLMIGLFFGEIHRLPVLRRFTLVLAGFAAALLLNIVRTCILVYLAARYGM